MGFFQNLQQKRWRKSISKEIAILKKIKVSDVMTTYVVSVKSTDTIIYAATKMIAEDISCLAVMDGDKLEGIMSERDFLQKVPLNKKAFGMKVKSIMTPKVITIPPEATLPEAVKLMKEKKFRRLVIAKDGKILGILTQTDLSKALKKILVYPVFPVSEIMTKKVLTVPKKSSFSKARKKMQKQNVGSILITDKNEILGIFTEYDVVMQFYDKKGELTIRDINEFMRKFIHAASPDMDVLAANRLLLDKRMRRLPIVVDGKLVGIVTQTDIIRFVYTNLETLENANEFRMFSRNPKFKEEFSGERLKLFSLELK